MRVNYQLVTIGQRNGLKDRVIESLLDQVVQIGLDPNVIQILDNTNYFRDHKNNSPTVALYFGAATASGFVHEDVLKDLIHEAAFIIPVVEDLTDFGSKVPETLKKINGAKLGDANDIAPLVSSILEGFSLLRTSRRLFISYKRDDSTGVAIQLYEALEKGGFDVFLDTHSVRPGDEFQDELWHRMADTDVVVLLNSANFSTSRWTTKELAEANGMSITILQLNWPSVAHLTDSELSIQHSLTETDFEGSSSDRLAHLHPSVIDEIISKVEGVRARALAARQDKLTTEFKRAADNKTIAVDLQPQKYFSLDSNGRKKIIIPTIGIPQAFTYNRCDEQVKRDMSDPNCDVFLLYDHKNIRERWLKHLSWLDDHLPVKSFKIIDAEQWLSIHG